VSFELLTKVVWYRFSLNSSAKSHTNIIVRLSYEICVVNRCYRVSFTDKFVDYTPEESKVTVLHIVGSLMVTNVVLSFFVIV